MWCVLVAVLLSMTSKAEPLKFTNIAKGTQSGIEEPRTVAIRSRDEWAELWKQHAPGTQAPAVDWQQSMVLAVFSGTKPTAAHGVEISQVDARESEVIVTYRLTSPGPSDMVAQVLTFPFHIVRTEARAGKVTFKLADSGR